MQSFLWKETRDLHHACEEHEVGAAMASGKPSMQWYVDWMNALLTIHSVIDKYYPTTIHRVDRLKEDLKNTLPRNLNADKEYVATLNNEKSIAGAAYVLTGAHLMGGEVMRRRLDGYPTKHLEWDDRKLALKELNKLRSREDVVDEARMCFSALLQIMDEIRGT
jgi:heme oxygenase